jgi:hypothetical protein
MYMECMEDTEFFISREAMRGMSGREAHEHGEDAEVDEEGKQEHAHCAVDALQGGYLQLWVEEHLAEAPEVYCTRMPCRRSNEELGSFQKKALWPQNHTDSGNFL